MITIGSKTIPAADAGYEAWVYFIPRNIYNSPFPYAAAGDDVAAYNTQQQKNHPPNTKPVYVNINWNYQRAFITVSMTHVESGVKT